RNVTGGQTCALPIFLLTSGRVSQTRIDILQSARSPQPAYETDKPIYKVIAIPTHSVCLTVFRVCTLLTMTPTTLQPHRSVPVVLGILTFGLGFGLGFALPPLVGLLQTALESSPFPTTGLVQLIAEMPFSRSVPIMSALGLIA